VSGKIVARGVDAEADDAATPPRMIVISTIVVNT
jgi:hypothetical protein